MLLHLEPLSSVLDLLRSLSGGEGNESDAVLEDRNWCRRGDGEGRGSRVHDVERTVNDLGVRTRSVEGNQTRLAVKGYKGGSSVRHGNNYGKKHKSSKSKSKHKTRR